MGRALTYEERGATDVAIQCDSDERKNITSWLAHCPTGKKLTVGFILPGKTDASEERARAAFPEAVASGEVAFYHEPQGWTDGPVCKKFEHLLAKQGIKDCLWDSFSVQKGADARAEAAKIGLNLYFVAAGMTGRDQPQDYRTNGEMTRRVDSVADELRVTDPDF
jgi:hypothetical protein